MFNSILLIFRLKSYQDVLTPSLGPDGHEVPHGGAGIWGRPESHLQGLLESWIKEEYAAAF